MRRLLLLLFTFLLTGVLYSRAEAQTVRGTVKNAKTGEPLAGANVIQVNTQHGVTTDADGSFNLSLNDTASHAIRISYIGFKTKKVEVAPGAGEQIINLIPKTVITDQVLVEALRVDEASPMTHVNVSRQEIEEEHIAQDIPYLVGNLPSVTTTSDAGAGIGYTSLRIRGVDQRRINVTINGIPLNDAESHGVFWVDIPDLAASVESIQIQRGVGTSTNGAGAFGATMNLQTTSLKPDTYGIVNSAVGSFDTQKYNVKIGSGLMENGWQFDARLSKIASDGYIERAFSDLKSFYVSASHYGENSLFKAVAFSGKEQTYQAWYGVPEDSLDTHRTYNPAGQEKEGEPYENQTDNYQQDHYQLHYSYQFRDGWNLNTSLHMTYGRGFFEEYKADELLKNYDIQPVSLGDTTVTSTDLIRDRWLDNWFYGTVFSTNYTAPKNWNLTIGGAYNEYDGKHFGEVNWARFAGNSEKNYRYYDNNSFKTDFNVYAKWQYEITERLTGYADIQYRAVTYDFLGKDIIDQKTGEKRIIDVRQHDALYFWNPKGGFNYQISENQRAYASFSVGNKEPTRNEYVNSTPESRPRHESLYDWEAGYQGHFDRLFVHANLYYMLYDDQLILTGEVNDVGAFIRQNVNDSYRSGVELQLGYRVTDWLEWQGNATFSQNKIEKYTQYISNYDTGVQIARTYNNTDIAFSPEFIGNSILTFNRNGFTAELSSKYVSRQYLDNTSTKSRSIDPYFINDIRLSYTFADILKNVDARTSLQVNNLFDVMYSSNGYTYGFIAGGTEIHKEFYYPQAGRNYLFEVKLKF